MSWATAWEHEARDKGGQWTDGSAAGAIVKGIGKLTGERAAKAIGTGNVPDTAHLHTNAKGAYSPEREALHKSIIDHFMAGSRAQAQPHAIFTAGGAASGKSALAGRARESGANLPVPRGHVYVNPDDIKEMLPEYNDLKEAGHADIAAAATHEESSDIAMARTAISMARHRHLVIDGTGNSAIGKFGTKLRAAKHAGYTVTARYAHISTSEAIEREHARAARTGRHVPEQALRHQHHTVSASFDQDVKNIPGVNIEIYSTAGRGKPTLIAKRPERGNMQVTQPSKYREMIEKGR